MEKKAAVVIVNYNSGTMLARCLDALEKQQVFPDMVVVIDNASTDDSLVCTEVFGLTKKVIALDENVGFAAANNVAIAALDGYEYVALLNPDAFPDEKWLGELISAAERHPQVDSFASRMYCDTDSGRLDGAGDAYHFTGLAWRRGHGADVADQKYADQIEVFSACAGAALYRRESIVAVGGFDERFFCYMEDVDLGYRLRLAGGKCLYIPAAIVKHKGSAITGKLHGFSTYHGHRNLVWVFLKNTPAPLLLLFMPFHLLMTIVLLPVMFFRGELLWYLKAKLDALMGIRDVLKNRSEIQEHKNIGSCGISKSIDFALFTKGKN